MTDTTAIDGAELARHYLASPAARAFPYESFRRLVAAGPVHQASTGVWLVVHHAEALAVLRDDRRFSRAAATRQHGAVEGSAFDVFSSKLLSNDDPSHARLRRLVAPSFTPAAVRTRERAIEAVCDEFLDEVEPRGSMEVGRDFSYPLAERVVCLLFGMPFEDFARIEQWAEKTIELPPGGDVDAHRVEAEAAILAFAAYVRELIGERREAPGDDLLSKFVAAEEEGDRLSETEMVAITYELITAGHETTAKLIPNALYQLLTHPEQLARLRQDPSLSGGLVAETLRYESSAHMSLPRVAVEDVELGDSKIACGDTVIALIGAANRDPAVFDRPDEFDITRQPNGHIGFGFGSHFCIGHALAQSEARTAIERLLARFDHLQLAGDHVEWVSSNMTRGVAPLWVRW
jgi:cytochrome P450